MKYTDNINMPITNDAYITNCPSFKMAIEMDNASVLKVMKANATERCDLCLLNKKNV